MSPTLEYDAEVPVVYIDERILHIRLINQLRFKYRSGFVSSFIVDPWDINELKIHLALPKIPTANELRCSLSYAFPSNFEASQCIQPEYPRSFVVLLAPWLKRVKARCCGHIIRYEMSDVESQEVDEEQEFCFACDMRLDVVVRHYMTLAFLVLSDPLWRAHRDTRVTFHTARGIWERVLQEREDQRQSVSGKPSPPRSTKVRFADQKHRDESQYRRPSRYHRFWSTYKPDVTRWADTTGKGYQDTSWRTVSWEDYEEEINKPETSGEYWLIPRREKRKIDSSSDQPSKSRRSTVMKFNSTDDRLLKWLFATNSPLLPTNHVGQPAPSTFRKPKSTLEQMPQISNNRSATSKQLIAMEGGSGSANCSQSATEKSAHQSRVEDEQNTCPPHYMVCNICLLCGLRVSESHRSLGTRKFLRRIKKKL